MKRLYLVLLLALLLVSALFVAGLVVAPAAVRHTWNALALPPDVPDQLLRAIPVQGLAEVDDTEARETITASGIIEAEETRVMAEVAGQVMAVLADEGQPAAAGQVLVRLDDSQLRARLNEADQAVATAQAGLEAARASPQESQIAIARASLAQAQAAENGAQQALADARRARENLLELDAQIHAVAARAALADRLVEQARAREAGARVLKESVAGDGSDQGKTQHAVYEKQEAAARASIAAAEQEAEGARRLLNYLQQMRARPVAMEVQVRAAEGQARLAAENVEVAQAALALQSAGPRQEAINLAQAQLDQAKAGRQVIVALLAKTSIASPMDGVVIERSVEPGEIAAPGVPLLTVVNLNQVSLTIYVPEDRIASVQVGQPWEIGVDAYPGRTFSGSVSYISPEAEFTPRDIQTPEERVKSVFAVEIAIDNPAGALKPGMPADATLVP